MTRKILNRIIKDTDGRYTIKNIDPDKLIQLAADVMESQIVKRDRVASPDEMKVFIKLKIGALEHEVFTAFFLSNSHEILAHEVMFRGTINGASVHPREVVKEALKHNAAAVIFAHNHPSGNREPSEADKAITIKLKDALNMIDIRTLDHFIVTRDSITSFAEKGLL